jgi:GAF domain-containing protein
MAELDLSLAVAKLVDQMKKAGGAPNEEALNLLATTLAQPFKAKKDEVAILRLFSDGRMLIFLFPIKLSRIGAIPLTASHSLAAKTIREKRGEIVNNFSVYKHPTVFEAVDLTAEEKAAPIQKILSAPMIVNGKVVGAIQISRKGKPGDPVGPDFSPRDLGELTTVGTILGQFVADLPAPAPAHQKPAASPPKA